MKAVRADFTKLRTTSIRKRKNKVSVKDFGNVPETGMSFADFFQHCLPSILKGQDMRDIVCAIKDARKARRSIHWCVGDSVIKSGLGPVLNAMIERGFITGLAVQGAVIIHDLELALIGETSEDVAVTIRDGSFGMAEETGRLLNEAINRNPDAGMGEAVLTYLRDIDLPFADHSLLAYLRAKDIPFTVHVAIGTDITHMHPTADGAALGRATHVDFQKFAGCLPGLSDGGVIVNMGSAVILPEVFLKALSVTRNLGHEVINFTAVNFDMIQHYRPSVNVVGRPTDGGRGYAITGHHELMLPLLYRALLD